MTVRGIRNNNPGNIRHGPDKWDGLAPDQSSDPSFCVFIDAKYGIRVIAKLLMAYQDYHGLKTILGIINRWAPQNENNTASYATFVAKRVGVPMDVSVNVHDVAVMKLMVEAIIAEENANFVYPENTVLEGLQLAGIHIDGAPVVKTEPPSNTAGLSPEEHESWLQGVSRRLLGWAA